MQILVFLFLLWSINAIPCWQGIYYLCFMARQDYFILSRFNRKMGRKREIPENNHPTIRKKKLSNLWPERDSNPQQRVDERLRALKISDHGGRPVRRGQDLVRSMLNSNNIGSQMQDSIYYMLLNSTKTLKTRFRTSTTNVTKVVCIIHLRNIFLFYVYRSIFFIGSCVKWMNPFGGSCKLC